MKISAQRKKTGTSVDVEVDLPTDLDSLVARYGADSVFSHAKGSMIVALQGFMRGQLDRGKTTEEITAGVAEWKPGQKRPGKSPQEKARESIAALSAEDRAALLKEIRASQKQAT